MSDQELRVLLVRLGVTLGTRRYAGQHPTEAANEFADRTLPIVKAIENRVVARVRA